MINYENDCVGCDYCYNCGAKETPHYYCDECGEEIGDDELYEIIDNHYHEECWYNKLGYQETLTLENAEKYGEKNKATFELNSFYTNGFTAAQIDEIIKREYLAGTTEAERKTEIEDFAEWDKEAWMHAVND